MTGRDEEGQSHAPPSGSFVDTLARVLGLARKAEASTEFRAEFREELQALPRQSQARLSVLLNIGRDAHGLALRAASSTGAASTGAASSGAASSADSNPVSKDSVSKDSVSKDSVSKDSVSKDSVSKDSVSKDSVSTDSVPLDVLALCDATTLSQRYLERGLAAAWAGKLTLDATANDSLKPDQRLSVSERAWSRFGRELASSEPGDWSWFACYKGRSRVLDKLYVRHGNSAWWSFATSIDRPLREQTAVDRKRATNGRQDRHGSSLESLLTQEGSPSRRALCRALTSVHARLGKVQSDTAHAVGQH